MTFIMLHGLISPALDHNTQQFHHVADYDHAASFTTHEATLDYTQTATGERVYIATLTLIRPR